VTFQPPRTPPSLSTLRSSAPGRLITPSPQHRNLRDDRRSAARLGLRSGSLGGRGLALRAGAVQQDAGDLDDADAADEEVDRRETICPSVPDP